MLKRFRIFLTAAFVALVATSANAATIRWNLDNVTGDFGNETVSGFFDYNTVTDSIVNWSISAAGPIPVASFGSSFLSTGSPIFSQTTPITTYPFFQLDMETGAGSNSVFAGSTNVPLLNSPNDSAFIDRFDQAGSLTITQTGIFTNENGQLVGLTGTLDYGGAVGAAATPVPGSLPLFLSGIMGLAFFGYRHREMAKARKS